MTLLPDRATVESVDRLRVAQQLIARCPATLGSEIALTGSVARGVADRHSDIELNLWVDQIPVRYQWRGWLVDAGASEIGDQLWPPDGGGFCWVTCRFSGIWIEIGWSAIDSFSDLIDRLSRGEVEGHGQMIVGSMILQAVALRTDGRLAAWQGQLEQYPENLRRALIRGNTAVWSDPHVPGVRWALAERGERFALAMRLQWDIQNLLAVLWAINRHWEQDWKWTDQRALDLPICPPDLSDRINQIFDLSDPSRSVGTAFALIDEALQLVPQEFDVATALENIRRARRDELISEYHRACAAIIRDGAILMLYVVHRDHAHWSLPGGTLDPGETPEEAVLREVSEETGLLGERPRFLYERPLHNGWETCFLIVVSLDQEATLGIDPERDRAGQELTAVAWRPLDEVADDVQVTRVLAALAAIEEPSTSESACITGTMKGE